MKEPLFAMLESRLHLCDRSLFVKFAIAPGALLGLLLLTSVMSLGALLSAKSSAAQIVEKDMRTIQALDSISARFERADGDLYRLLASKAAGNSQVDVPAHARQIQSDLQKVQADLAALRPNLADQRATAHVMKQLAGYREAVNVVTSMLDVDFTASAGMVAPFRANAVDLVGDMNRLAKKGADEARAHASAIAYRIRLFVPLVVATTLAIAAFGFALTRLIGRATVESITRIASATSSLAAENYDVDLDALNRRDELGAVVAALKTFRAQALEAQRLQREKAALEETARMRDEQQRSALEATRQEAETKRRAQLKSLAEEFDKKVAATIRVAHDAMQRLDGSLNRLGTSANDNSRLAGDLEQVAEAVATEMASVGTETELLMASIHKIDQEVDRTHEVAKSIADCADTTRAALAASEGNAVDVEQVVGVIDQISRQTRTLALNATIEAARAGDVGRGFAVIASEIRSLSSRTGDETGVVRQRVNDIQSGMVRCVEATGQLGDLIRTMNHVASHVADASATQVRSTGAIGQRVSTVRSRTQAVVQASAAVRVQAADNQAIVRELSAASASLQQSLSALSKDAQLFTENLK